MNAEVLTYEVPPAPRVWPAVCVDIETLATCPAALVLEIGAVCFDPATGELGPEFSAEVSMRAADQGMRSIDEETFQWWAERVKEGAMMPGMHGGMDLRAALEWLCEWSRKHVAGSAEWWAWGTDFDFGILADALRAFRMDAPWAYHRQRCARTLCKVTGTERMGDVSHVAVEDARQEAAAVCAALRLVVRRPVAVTEGGAA